MSVAIVKVGARTAIGLNAKQTGFMVRAGFPALGEAPIANAAGESITMAVVPTIDSLLVGSERLEMLALPALEEVKSVCRDATVCLRLSVDDYVMNSAGMAPFQAAIRRELSGADVRIDPDGEAGLVKRWAEAVEALETRRFDVAVLGGVHTDYDSRVILELDAAGRLFSTENLDARIPGEASGFVVLMREGDAKRRGLSPLARVLGTGMGRATATPTNDAPAYEAQGLTAALRQAGDTLLRSRRAAGWMLVDGTFEMYRMMEWQAAFVRVQGILGNPYVIESPAQRIGYLGAAAMPVLVGLAATGWEYGYGPSPIAVVTAGNDGGERVAMVLSSAKEAEGSWAA